MKIIKLIVSMLMFVTYTSSFAANPELYQITTTVESAGKTIGTWMNLVSVEDLKKDQPIKVINVVDAKQVDNGYQKYYVGFNIKMNLSRVQKANILSVITTFSSPQNIYPYNDKIDKDESTVAQGLVATTPLTTVDVTQKLNINTITFSKIYDITVPRDVAVPIARFVAEEGQKKSLVTIKLKIEKQ